MGDNRKMRTAQDEKELPFGRWRSAVASGAVLYAVGVVVVALWTASRSAQPLQSNIRYWNGVAHVFLVARGGVLDSAGVRPGDELLALDGASFSSGMELADRWQGHRPGDTARWTVRRGGGVLELEMKVESGLTASRVATVGIAIGVLLLVGAGTYALRPGTPATLLFLLFCMSSVISDASMLVSLAGTSWNERVLTFAYTMTSFFGPALLLHLFLIFPARGPLQRRLRVLLPAVYGAALLLGLVYYLPTVIPALTELLAAPAFHRVVSGAYDASVILAYLVSTVSLGTTAWRANDLKIRLQARLLFAGLALLVLLQIGLWELPLRLTGISLIPVETQALFDVIVPLCVAASIVRHRLFDINILVRFGLVYGLASAGAAAVFVAAVGGVGWLVHRIWPPLDPFIVAGAAAVSALVFTPIRRWVQEQVDRRLYSRRYSYRQAVRETASRLAGILDPAAAARFIRERVNALLEPAWSDVLVREEGGGPWRCLGGEEFEEPSWKDEDGFEELAAQLAGKESAFVPEDLELPAGRRVELAVPIRESGVTLGVLLLGGKALEAPYLPEDLDLLTTLAEMAGVVIRRGWLMEERALRERLAAVGSATSALAHELKNPVAAVKSSAAVLRRRLKDDPRSAELTEVIEGEMDRLERTIGDVLSYVRPGQATLSEVDLKVLVRQVASLLEDELAAAGMTIETRLDPATPRILADPDRLRRLLLNLLLNARQAMPTGGRIEVEVGPWRDATGRELGVEIIVLDRGTGFSDESLRRGFEPFFTTKKFGTGLGLANVHRIVREHGGEVSLANRGGGGAVVTVRLVRLPAQEPA